MTADPLRRAAARAPGRLVLAAFACLALWPQYGLVSLLVIASAAVAAFRPSIRPAAFSLVGVVILTSQVLPQSLAAGLGFRPILFAAAWTAAVLAWSRIQSLRRIGLLPLHAAVIAGLATLAWANVSGLRPIAASFILQQLAMAFLWRTSYWVRWRSKAAGPAPLVPRLYALVPFSGSGGVPIGKSPEYFERHAARSAEDVASAHLEGTWLLLLALAYRLILFGLERTFWNTADDVSSPWVLDVQPWLPSMTQLFAGPGQFSFLARWIGLFTELVRAILTIAVFGHTAVGICHLMGYRIPRNTRAPLWSNSILDFWTRYYFYFKELLLDFFFFPVYLKLKRFSPAFRTVAATFAAACAGNFYYHLLLYSGVLVQAGNAKPAGYLHWIGARAVYCVLLAGGISVSMLRTLENPKRIRRRSAGIVISLTFFALIHIWSAGDETVAIGQRWGLLESLFGFPPR